MNISIAVSAKASRKNWKNITVNWFEFAQKLTMCHRSHLTRVEYLALSKDEQGQIKDVGGYVGGYLRGGARNKSSVQFRQLLTLDIDYGTLDFWEYFCFLFPYEAVLHGTFKHCDATPRYRLIIPLSRPVYGDEYEAVSRKLAQIIGIELFDPTTFQPERLMFYPATAKDSEYYYRYQQGVILDPDYMLSQYVNWSDVSEWAFSSSSESSIRSAISKQQDPLTKEGIVGAFCRAYTVQDVIDKFLQKSYTQAGYNRYTYVNGSTSGGLVVYDDKFSYSHHSTDPTSGKLCNAFDLARVHLFGVLDTDSKASGKQTPSYKEIEKLALKDPEVLEVIARENLEQARYEFMTNEDFNESIALDFSEWMKALKPDSKNGYEASAPNINAIVINDINLKNKFKYNSFDNKPYIDGAIAWSKETHLRPVRDVDFSGLRNYIECVYGIVSPLKIDDAMRLSYDRNKFNPVKEYLDALQWDGVARIDTLLIDAFNAVDNIYTREASRKTLIAGVARVYNSGCKFDTVLTLVGDQGTGKSTFVRKLGVNWYSDTFSTVTGKESFEQLQGAWIIEMGELAGLKKAEVDNIKHFLSKGEDAYRPPYGRTVENFKRSCIFIGTTNERKFLKDPSGNRRFLPIEVNEGITLNPKSSEFEKIVPQLWAEAKCYFEKGEPLYLSKEAEAIAFNVRAEHYEADERTGAIEDYLNMLLPDNWDYLDIYERRNYITNETMRAKGTIKRQYVCTFEVWCECFGKKLEDMTKFNSREINDALRAINGWQQSAGMLRFKNYGRQKYYERG